MQDRPVVPIYSLSTQRCHKHPDRTAHSIRSGKPVCKQCAFNDSFYGPGTSKDTDALNRRVENLELQLRELTVKAEDQTAVNISPEKSHKRSRHRWNAASQRRVEEVKRALSELKALRADFSEGNDYERFARTHADWLIFRIAKKHTHWHERLARLPNRVGRLEGMAQQMVADWRGVQKTTVRWDWTHRRKACVTQAV